MLDIKIPQTHSLSFQDSCPMPSVLLINVRHHSLGHLLPTRLFASLPSPPYFLALPLAATSFRPGFLRRIFRRSCRKPSFSHFLSCALSLPTSPPGLGALLMKSRAASCTMYSWVVRANIKSFATTYCETGETTWQLTPRTSRWIHIV